MLRIRKEQIAAFADANLESFTRHMARHLRRVLPVAVAKLDDGALLDSLRRRLTQALSHGITDRFDALRYLESSYVLGWTDDGPDDEARAVLAQGELSVEEKVELIQQRTLSL
jgi:hypothetical protein